MAIFAYQAYWLVSMYHTMKSDMEHSIIEAMRTSDYNETDVTHRTHASG